MTRDEVCAEDWRPQSYFVHAGQGSGLPHCLGTSSDQLERLGQVAGPGAPARECAGQTVRRLGAWRAPRPPARLGPRHHPGGGGGDLAEACARVGVLGWRASRAPAAELDARRLRPPPPVLRRSPPRCTPQAPCPSPAAATSRPTWTSTREGGGGGARRGGRTSLRPLAALARHRPLSLTPPPPFLPPRLPTHACSPMLPATLAARAEAEDYAPPPLLLLLGSGGASRAPSPPSSTSAASRLSSATPPPEAGRGAPVPAPLSIHDWLVQAADCEGYCPNNHYAETRRRSMEGAPGCMRGQVAVSGRAGLGGRRVGGGGAPRAPLPALAPRAHPPAVPRSRSRAPPPPPSPLPPPPSPCAARRHH